MKTRRNSAVSPITSISFSIRAAMEQQEHQTSYKNVEFTAYIWQENAITSLTPSDKKKQSSFHPNDLDSSKTCTVDWVGCVQPAHRLSIVYGCDERRLLVT